MRTFTCTCGNRLFFENHRCMACGRDTGFVPELGELVAIEGSDATGWRALHPRLAGRQFRRCSNYAHQGVCNWMVPDDEDHAFCQACRLNQVIPDLTRPMHRLYWARIEAAKRRLIYELNVLELPVFPRMADPEKGLGFAFMADAAPVQEFSDPLEGNSRVLTGHNQGLITINIAEADDIVRENMRQSMGERYRSLLGHFRHEIGHYYWLLLISDTPALLDAFRQCFGDERADYQQALDAYYANGPLTDWPRHFISAYASSHPWEDWAETFSHYLHMTDTLEAAVQLRFSAVDLSDRSLGNFDAWLSAWVELTTGLNELNRCMGHSDLYPFVLSPGARAKLYCVHELLTVNAARPLRELGVVTHA